MASHPLTYLCAFIRKLRASPGKVQTDQSSPIASKTLTGKYNFALPGGIDLNKAKLNEGHNLYRTRAQLNATPIHEKQTNRL